MRPTRVFSASLFGILLAAAGLTADSVRSQLERQTPAETPAPPATKTKLQVREFSKEFEQWVKSLTITTPEVLTFLWTTDEANVVSATWMVTDKPPSSSSLASAALAPKLIKSGNLGKAPAKGHVAMFDIDFGKFVPKKPPQTPRTYWVFITPRNARHQAIGPASVPVKIVYRESTAQPVELGECFKNADCYPGYFCNLNLNECRVIAYECDGQFVLGSNGSKFDCTPYLCQAGQCLKTCASVDDCAKPFVCDYDGQCVSPPKKNEASLSVPRRRFTARARSGS